MPLSRYDRHFGGDAAKAYRALVKRYGAKRGRSIFYALVNRREDREVRR